MFFGCAQCLCTMEKKLELIFLDILILDKNNQHLLIYRSLERENVNSVVFKNGFRRKIVEWLPV